MIEILLYVSSFLIILGYIGYFVMIFIGRGKIVSKDSGFDVTKDIISEYDSINVIETSSYFTTYNLKRKVIRLDKKTYYGKDISAVSLSLMEAGISIVDNNNNKYIDIFRHIFNNLKIMYIFPILALIINNSSFNISDSKVSIILILLFTFLTYIMIQIKSEACLLVDKNLGKIKGVSKDNHNKIINFMNRLVSFDKLIFFGEIIILVRLVLILLKIG